MVKLKSTFFGFYIGDHLHDYTIHVNDLFFNDNTTSVEVKGRLKP